MAAEVDTAVRACCRPHSARSLYTQPDRHVPAGGVEVPRPGTFGHRRREKLISSSYLDSTVGGRMVVARQPASRGTKFLGRGAVVGAVRLDQGDRPGERGA
jgi:hypothetical protein